MAFTDDFSSYPQNQPFPDGTSFGPWTVQWSGYGAVQVIAADDGAALSLQPQTSVAAGETHSALVVGPSYDGQVSFQCGMTTSQQLRQNSPPNPWEVAWLVWSCSDDNLFYYFSCKPNGWELGKLDPAYDGNQRFLQTGNNPTFPVGQRVDIGVEQVGASMTITVNDNERPHTSGRIGFYVEDAQALFDTVSASGP
jgi:hypothetical protein